MALIYIKSKHQWALMWWPVILNEAILIDKKQQNKYSASREHVASEWWRASGSKRKIGILWSITLVHQ